MTGFSMDRPSRSIACPGRGAASLRRCTAEPGPTLAVFVTVMGPGSAAHRSASASRCAASGNARFTDPTIPVPIIGNNRATKNLGRATMKLGAAIAEIMKREGIEILCGYPVNHLIEFAAAADIRPIIVRQERIGLHMADAISPRDVRAHASARSACSTAPARRTPWRRRAVLRRIRARAGAAAGLRAQARQYRPEFQFRRAMRGVAKSAEPITLASEVGNILRRAFTQAEERPRRPGDRRNPGRHLERGGRSP